jgi:hypothetical protein
VADGRGICVRPQDDVDDGKLENWSGNGLVIRSDKS